jgi:hypothetical protein
MKLRTALLIRQSANPPIRKESPLTKARQLAVGKVMTVTTRTAPGAQKIS